jgi:hypothetical protein
MVARAEIETDSRGIVIFRYDMGDHRQICLNPARQAVVCTVRRNPRRECEEVDVRVYATDPLLSASARHLSNRFRGY